MATGPWDSFKPQQTEESRGPWTQFGSAAIDEPPNLKNLNPPSLVGLLVRTLRLLKSGSALPLQQPSYTLG